VLARHAGAARFAFNQCLQMVKTALTQRKTDPDTDVPWTGFDLINGLNAWKKSEDAGRVFTVGSTGEAEVVVTGLRWRHDVCQQVLDEAAVDCGRALAAWSDSRSGKRKGKRVGFPRFKKKTGGVGRFGCATNTAKASRRRSGSAITVGRVSLKQALPCMRGPQQQSRVDRSDIHLRVRTFLRLRSQRRDEPCPLGPTASPRSPDPQATGPGHQRPPTGRR
jgi:hypothetical protein